MIWRCNKCGCTGFFVARYAEKINEKEEVLKYDDQEEFYACVSCNEESIYLKDIATFIKEGDLVIVDEENIKKSSSEILRNKYMKINTPTKITHINERERIFLEGYEDKAFSIKKLKKVVLSRKP